MEEQIQKNSRDLQLYKSVQGIVNRKYIVAVPIDDPPSIGEKQLSRMRLHLWEAAAHHLLKLEWHSKHKHPKNFKGWIELSEPLGKFLQQMFLLAEKCHSRQTELGYKLDYPHAGRWLEEIQNETFYQGGILGLLPEDQKRVEAQKAGELANNHQAKNNGIRRLLAYCQSAAKFENPYRESGRMRHFSALLDAAIALSTGEGDRFRNQTYAPFIEAWSNAVKSLQSPDFQRCDLRDGKLVFHGPGRSKKVLSRNGSRKPLFGKGYKSYYQSSETRGFSSKARA